MRKLPDDRNMRRAANRATDRTPRNQAQESSSRNATPSMLLLTDRKRVLLERRPPTGIWGGLLSLPEGSETDAVKLARRHGAGLQKIEALTSVKHSFTHFHLLIHPLLCTVTPATGVAGARNPAGSGLVLKTSATQRWLLRSSVCQRSWRRQPE